MALTHVEDHISKKSNVKSITSCLIVFNSVMALKRAAVHKASEREIGNNKAGYMATTVACGWAGVILRSLNHLGRSHVKRIKNVKNKI